MKINSPHFCLSSTSSPTFYNLSYYLQLQGWGFSNRPELSVLTEQHFNFDEQAAQCLEFKHLLSQLINKHCPEVMPETYIVKDHNWSEVLALLSGKFNKPWILKPSLLNNGQHIKIFPSYATLQEHFLYSRRLGGSHVLQSYLSPHLLRDEHKYSIRMFVVATEDAGIYLYRHGYVNVSCFSYTPSEFTNLRAHLTNEHLYEQESNVIQIPSQRFSWFGDYYPHIKVLLNKVMKGWQQEYHHVFNDKNPRRLAIFGFDLMVDQKGRLWLLEANHGPCFPIAVDHPLQQHLYQDFWQNFIKLFVLSLGEKKIKKRALFTDFDSIDTSIAESK